MSVNLGGWIHSFAVTETGTHKKGHTIYKITSIVFPRSVPEALTCVTVWKRFREIKRLYRELSKRHKTLHLRGQVPEPREPGLFKRFDPDVIAGRRDYIIQLLDFAAQHPALYKSQPFLNFFETDSSMAAVDTPSPHRARGNIESICDSCDLPFQSTVQMIESMENTETKDQLSPTFVSGSEKVPETEQPSAPVEDEPVVEDRSIEEDTSSISSVLQLNIYMDNDYIYEAAFEFSQAVQAEVNVNYKEAYRKYNMGIEKLLEGSKDDQNEDRRTIAKAKVTKYMSRAQEIYEQHLMFENERTKKTLHLSIDEADSPQNIHLERPWNQLSKFKVIQIIDTLMQVQDVTTKSTYIMKTIQKPSTNTNSHSIFLPHNVPYMVKLLGFFQSDSTIFLLLQHAKGGKLFDYIKTYTPTGHITKSLSEIFTDFQISKATSVSAADAKSATPTAATDQPITDDSGFVDIPSDINKDHDSSRIESPSPSPKVLPESQSIPSFGALSQEIDVNDLVSCSQKLLKAVSNTLEHIKDIRVDADKSDSCKDPANIDPTVADEPHKKTEVEEFYENNKKSSSPIESITIFSKHVVVPEVMVRQWARELITAIESLHLKGVVLGDLHPRNILLGSKGQLLLSYFYQCAEFDAASQIAINSWAFEGMYVAPERPLTTKSDWWSFGVILFELLTGYSYRSCHPAGYSCYYEVQYPDIEIGKNAVDLVNGLLQQDPVCRYQIDQIKTHEFFDGTDWDNIRGSGVN